jgi:hypothetical protein
MLHATAPRADDLAIREVGGHVAETTVVVDATPSQIYALVTDYARWPSLFSDVRGVAVEGGDREHARVRFYSNVIDHEVIVQFHNIPDRAIRFDGIKGPRGGKAWGSYLLEPIDGGRRTRVVASLSLDVVGVARVFVRESKLVAMREAKLRVDMTDVMRALAR